jgi:serine/threonine-protein kinase
MGTPWFDARRPDSVPTPPDIEIDYDEFRDLTPIGEGGKASVYAATISRDGERLPVAVKEPNSEGTLHQTDIERFEEEAQTWSSVDDHEGIVTVLDYDTVPVPWIAMEYLEGGSLRDRLPLEGVSRVEALWIATRIADAVRHAHRLGVVHLDLKPANVLFQPTESGEWAVPKVSDWGLARRLLDGETDAVGYSRRYAAPEQLYPDDFGAPDNRTDVFQLGVLTYELFAGEQPFDRTPGNLSAPQGETEYTPLEATGPVPSHAINDALEIALQTDPDDRFEDVLDLRRALEEILETAIDNRSSGDGVDDPGKSGTDPSVESHAGTDDQSGPINPPGQKSTPDLTVVHQLLPNTNQLVGEETKTIGFTLLDDLSVFRTHFDLVSDDDRLPADAQEIIDCYEHEELLARVSFDDVQADGWDVGEHDHVGIDPRKFKQALTICDIQADEYDAAHFSLWRPDDEDAPYLVEFPVAPPELVAYHQFGDPEAVDRVEPSMPPHQSLCFIAPRAG